MLARRLYPTAANHRLGTLAALHRLPDAGRAHRALADAETTAHLLVRMQCDVRQRYGAALAGRDVTHTLLVAMQRASKAGLDRSVAHQVASQAQASA